MKVFYKPSFIRQYAGLEPSLKNEVKEKVSMFKDRKNHRQLKVHKLQGVLADRHSFSVNYRYRIVFAYLSRTKAVLLAIGDHDVYK